MARPADDSTDHPRHPGLFIAIEALHLLKPIVAAGVALVLMGVYAATGYYRLAASIGAFFAIPIAGALALNRVKQPWIRGLIGAAAVVACGLNIWQFILAML